LKDAYGPLFEKLELVNADLNDEASLDKAIEGATYVIHTASPFVMAVKNAQRDLIDPAVNGTLYACRAAHKHGVKRMVITSSCVSIMYNNVKDKVDINEENWTMDAWCDPYSLSKTLAEKAAWDHQKSV
jgi:dihydroflavonol-4-reductase